MELGLDITLIILLLATLFHALRLERALGVLKRDRAALETLVASFNASTLQAEQGIEKLRHAADGAGRLVARETERGTALKDDLVFLNERAERMADRLESALRAARAVGLDTPAEPMLRAIRHTPPAEAAFAPDSSPSPLRSVAERELLQALRAAR